MPAGLSTHPQLPARSSLITSRPIDQPYLPLLHPSTCTNVSPSAVPQAHSSLGHASDRHSQSDVLNTRVTPLTFTAVCVEGLVSLGQPHSSLCDRPRVTSARLSSCLLSLQLITFRIFFFKYKLATFIRGFFLLNLISRARSLACLSAHTFLAP